MTTAAPAQAAAPAPTLPARIILLCATLFAVLPLATDVTLVALPDIADEYGRGAAGGQQVMAAFVLGVALAHLFIGGLADRYGRRAVAIAGFAVFAAASVLAAFAINFEMLVAMRLIQGLAGATGPVLMRTIVRDLSVGGGGQRSMATIMGISGIAPLVAPIFGAVLAGSFGWRATFAFLAIYGAGTTLALILLLAETQTKEARSPRLSFLSLGVVKALLGDWHFLFGALVLAVGYGSLFTWLTTAGFLVTEQLGGTRNDLATLYVFGSVGYIAGGLVGSRLPESLNKIRFGMGLALIGALIPVALIATGTANVYSLASIALYYFGWSIAQPLGIATAMRKHALHAGQASAVVGVLQLSGGLILSPVAVALGGGAVAPILISAVLAVLLVLAFAIKRFVPDSPALL